MTASRVVLPAVLAGAALGVLAADGRWLPVATPVPLLLLALGCLALSRSLPAAWLAAALAALALGGAAGMWRERASDLPVGPGSISALVGTQEWRLTGTLSEEPRPKGERIQLILEDVRVSAKSRPGDVSASWRDAAGRLLVWLPRSGAFVVGDRITLSSRLDAPLDFDGFAYRAYLARQQIGAIARAYEARVIDHQLDPLNDAAAATRRWLLDGMNSLIPEPEAALGAGILLGVRSGISPEIGDAFARAGLTHVVAISGWNISIVAALIAALLRPLTRRPGGKWLVPIATVATIAGYVVLTGSTPSVVRAALMAGAMLIARLGGSRAHAASALMLAALVMLLAAPPVLWDVGFQLSLLATAGLIWFGRGMERRLARLPPVLREPVALTLAAQLTTLPIVLANFERLSLVAPLANVVVVPLVPLVMLCCAVAAPVGALIGPLHLPVVADVIAWLAGGTAWLYLRLMVVAGSAAAAVPFAAVDLAAPIWLAAAWYPALFIAWLRARRSVPEQPIEPIVVRSHAPTPRRTAALAARLLRPLLRVRSLAVATLVTLLAITLASLPDGRLHLVMLDVGQGDAILVESADGRTMLVDGGPDPDLVLRRLGEFLPFYRHSLDVVLLTHPHQDHVAGLVDVLRRFSVALVLDSGRGFDNPSYERFLELVRSEPDGALVTARAGQRFAIGGATTFTLLYPSEADAAGPLPDEDINNASVVGMLRFGAFSALLTGDAEAPVEARLAARQMLTPVDVLKVGHHGSRSSSSPALLQATDPALALISDGVDNDYGHPAPITLAALAARPGVIIHRTDLEGSIEVVSDGRSFGAASRIVRDPLRAVHALARSMRLQPASILAWPFQDSITPVSCSPPISCRTALSSTARASSVWPPKQRAWCNVPGSRSTFGSSRSPPCCTTSTSRKRAIPRASMACSPRGA